jgi:hypothetical protein
VTKRRRVTLLVERLIFCLVANRALSPMSKLAALEWAQSDTWLPGERRSPARAATASSTMACTSRRCLSGRAPSAAGSSSAATSTRHDATSTGARSGSLA